MQGKTSAESVVHLSLAIMQDMTNPFGTAHGGDLLKLMDNAAGYCAVKHSRGRVATRAISQVEFLAPIQLSNIAHCKAQLTYTSKHAMEIKVEITAEDVWLQTFIPSVKAYFICVLLNEDASQVLEIPPLLPANEAEKAEFEAGQIRMKQNIHY